jgi:hypothetical protein
MEDRLVVPGGNAEQKTLNQSATDILAPVY